MTPTSPVWFLILACGFVFALTWAASGLLLRLLVRFGLQDRANERSSHSGSKPRGGGLALFLVVIPAWLGWVWSAELGPDLAGFWPVMLGLALLGVISLLDDLHSLPAILRLLTQALAVLLGLFGMGEAGLVFQGLLPPLLDRLAAGLLWLWFVNLYNFMDGIDGLTGMETIALGLGLGAIAWTVGLGGQAIVFPLLLAAAGGGFLIWNWEPAKMFVGDVGSVPLGFLLGWLLLLLAAEGHWASALILPLYYLVDASLTLLRRVLRGERFWQAHRLHAYQRAAIARKSHAAIVLQVAALNVVLLGLALLGASGYPWSALAGALAAVACLLVALENQARKAV